MRHMAWWVGAAAFVVVWYVAVACLTYKATTRERGADEPGSALGVVLAALWLPAAVAILGAGLVGLLVQRYDRWTLARNPDALAAYQKGYRDQVRADAERRLNAELEAFKRAELEGGGR